MNLRSCRTRFANRRGATLLEFALILPVFLVLVFGTIEFARAFNIWQVVVNAAREGARTLALPAGSQSSQTLVNDRINSYLASNHLTECAPGCVTMTPDDDPTGSIAEVTVEYDYTFTFFGGVVTLIGGTGPGTITLSSTSRMRNE